MSLHWRCKDKVRKGVAVPAWTLEEWRLREQPLELLSELYEACSVLHKEAAPSDPRRPLHDGLAALRQLPASGDCPMLVARDQAGAVVGVASCRWQERAGWQHVLAVHVAVLPSSRRQGLGTLLLARSAEIARRQDRRLVTGRTSANVPAGAEFCRRFGAELALAGEENRLDLRAVDRGLLQRWLTDGPVRAPGYRLELVAGRTPTERADQVADLLNVMNTAPRENLDVGDIQVTVELLREREDMAAAAGNRHWAFYAVEETAARYVGVADVTMYPAMPDRVVIGNTAVAPAHRGKGLAKWLKAAIIQHTLEELPTVRLVVTWNARSNDAILAINRQLGFRAVSATATWQIPTSRLQARLACGPAARSDHGRDGEPIIMRGP
jgi:mycothiol synthase